MNAKTAAAAIAIATLLTGCANRLPPHVATAWENVQRFCPDVEVVERVRMDRDTFLSEAYVRPDQPTTVYVSEFWAMLYPQAYVEAWLAHEARHVRQLKADRARYLADRQLAEDDALVNACPIGALPLHLETRRSKLMEVK